MSSATLPVGFLVLKLFVLGFVYKYCFFLMALTLGEEPCKALYPTSNACKSWDFCYYGYNDELRLNNHIS